MDKYWKKGASSDHAIAQRVKNREGESHRLTSLQEQNNISINLFCNDPASTKILLFEAGALRSGSDQQALVPIMTSHKNPTLFKTYLML